MEYATWPTTLRCENHHEHVDDITWVRPLIEEPSEPTEWKPDILWMTCRDPNCASQVEAVSAPPPS
jgi:hypothetical protein